MTDAALQERESPARWLVCLLLVLLAHGGAGLFLLSRSLLPPAEVTVPAVMLDLAPITTPPPAETVPAEALPPEPVAEPELPPPIPVEIPPPEPPPELVLEQPPVPVIPEVPVPPKPPPRPEKKPPPPRQVVPRVTPNEPPPPIAEPAPAEAPAPAASSAAAAANWQSRLLAHLTRFKRYPPAAQMRREQGVALLRFKMTPSGEVLSFQLARSSGHAALDEETLELIRRAQPLPALPPDMPQQPIELVVPLKYELR
jgi:protein TonB